MVKGGDIHFRIDYLTKTTILKASKELGISLSKLMIRSALQFLTDKKLPKKLKKQIKEELLHQDFLLFSSMKTRKNNYRHQIYNAIDDILRFCGKSLRQHGAINMKVVISLLKDWKPVIKRIPLSMRKDLKEEIKFFNSLNDEKQLQTLFQNNKDSMMISTDSIFQKMKYLGSTPQYLKKHQDRK